MESLILEITKEDKSAVKRLLSHYPKMMGTIEALRRKENRTKLEEQTLESWGRIVNELDSAIKMIEDKETRRIVEHRYIKAKKYKLTVDLFYSENLSERTIDRRLNAGIESITEALKRSEVI